jgi:ribosomal protein L7/L12
VEILDVRALVPPLDELARRVEGASAAETEAVLGAARRLLAAIASASAMPADAAPAAVGDDWHAVRVDDGNGERSVVCSRERPGGEALLTGSWRSGTLVDCALRVGERAWGARQTAKGELWWSPGFAAEGPGDRRPEPGLAARAREEWDRWEREHALGEWVCPRCAWSNQATEPGGRPAPAAALPAPGSGSARAVCAGCGLPRGAAPPRPGGVVLDSPTTRLERSQPGPLLALAGDTAEWLARQLAAAAGEHLQASPQPLARPLPPPAQPPASPARFDLVLRAVAPTHRAATIELVCEVLATESGRRDLAAAARLVASLPATLRRGVAHDEAEAVRRAFADRGATLALER